MNPFLNSITITNFRSIKGSVTIPLNSPVILLHGPNGAGKTSALSALELALTGEVLAMRRTDPNYRFHLVHRGAELSNITLSISNLEPSVIKPQETLIKGGKVHGGALLSGELGRFFSERAYLGQATLAGLLEAYENANSREDSPLTHFVKDLLGLDTLDALIDGLHPSGDTRNMRRLIPEYGEAEREIQEIEGRLKANRESLLQLSSEAANLSSSVRDAIVGLSDSKDIGLALLPEAEMFLTRDDEEKRLVRLNGRRRDLASLRQRSASLSSSLKVGDEAKVALEEKSARDALDVWWSTAGESLETLIARLRAIFPDLPSVASADPEAAFQAASMRVDGELKRCARLLEEDDVLVGQAQDLNHSVEQSRVRVALVDEQIAEITTDVEGLSRALAAIIPHIHGEDCPVCGRDYREVSNTPLAQRVSMQVTKLTEQADRLQGLVQTRLSATTDLTKAERDSNSNANRRLNQELRDALKARISELIDASRLLAELTDTVEPGATAMRREAEARRQLSLLRSQNQVAFELRSAVSGLCLDLNQPELSATEAIPDAIQRLEAHVTAQEELALSLQARRRKALEQYWTLRDREGIIDRLKTVIRADDASRERLLKAFGLAEQRRQSAKAIVRAAIAARAEIVGRVFNGSLNKMWRDLFVRLVPTEPFVPAFRLPQSNDERFTAQLETVHRDGGVGGAPGAMLSHGNLNTAALTLFLALHLSVKPLLPWLVLDDPVQSMDELHIAQFAALLRALSKQHRRQIIIAVHERALFDYLTLELSPAFPGDRLVTVELTRSNSGVSGAEQTYYNWQPDRALA